MKNKTLLIAAAALAAGVISSEAQVYSANVVGYANVVIPGAGAYSLISNPFDDGNGNQLTNLVNSLPNKSSVTTWNGAGYDTSITKISGVWNGNTVLAPGTGFFVKNGTATSPNITNTFVGTVVAPSGGSVTNVLAAGYGLVGSQIPYGGDLTTDTNLNIGNVLPNKSTFTTWNTAGQTFDSSVTKIGGVWNGSVSVNVGQGVFINAKTGTNWVEVLP